MVIAAPAMVPEAAAAGALYVSAENAQFDNLFGGPMIVEVIVKDPNRSKVNESQGEPTVLVDNQKLRMAQGLDGNWYGYFADATDIATLVAHDDEDELRFPTSGTLTLGTSGTHSLATVAGTAITAYPGAVQGGGVIDNPPALSNWNSSGILYADGVTRTHAACTACGQISVASGEWPFIQAYDFTQGDFDVKLEQAGTDEIVTLDHNNADLDDYASLTLDRSSATQGAEIMLFIVDQQLNIDPTDEDVVIFKVAQGGVSSTSQVQWSNGTLNENLIISQTAVAFNATSDGHGFGDNGKLLINNNTSGASVSVLEKDQTLDDTILATSAGFTYLVFYEDGDNTGTFSNVDDADDANLNVKTTAKRGTTATFDYNDSAQSFIVSNDFGTIDMDESSIGDEWNSGETLAVTLVDQDLNKNTLNDEDMTLRTHNSTIPSLQIGSPITLTSSTTDSGVRESSEFGNANMTVGTFNKIGTITTSDNTSYAGGVLLNFTTTTVTEYRTAANSADYIFINYNVTEVIGEVSGIALEDASGDIFLAAQTTTSTATLLELTNTPSAVGVQYYANDIGETDALRVNFTSTTGVTHAVEGETLYVDIFTFGDKTGYDRQNNAIYRLLLEETGDDTGIFIGDVEFVMLNQINSDSSTVFSSITTLSDSIDIIVHEECSDEDATRMKELDIG